MELPGLLQNVIVPSHSGGVAAGGAGSTGSAGVGSGRQSAAEKLAQSAKVLEQPEGTDNKRETVALDHRFRVGTAVGKALQEATEYMNKLLFRDNMQMSIAADEHGSPLVRVNDLASGKILRDYPAHEVLRYFADAGRGNGVVIDGKV